MFGALLLSSSGMASQTLSREQYLEAKKQLASLEKELNWELVTLKVAMMMKSQHPSLVKFISKSKKEIVELESEIAHYKNKVHEWEQKNEREKKRDARSCVVQTPDRPMSEKLRKFLQSSREILAKMNLQGAAKVEQAEKLLEIRETTLHYLNQDVYMVLFKGKELVRIFKFKNVGQAGLTTSPSTLVKNGVHITYQEGHWLPARAYIAQLAYLEEIPITRNILLKLGPVISYQIGDAQKNKTRGSMAVMGSKVQLHIKNKYYIGLDSGFGIRFATSWILDLLKKRRGEGVGKAGEIMFQIGMVFPG